MQKKIKALSEEQKDELRAWRTEKFNKNVVEGQLEQGLVKKEKMESRISALETQNKDLNGKITQLVATISVQGQAPT